MLVADKKVFIFASLKTNIRTSMKNYNLYFGYYFFFFFYRKWTGALV